MVEWLARAARLICLVSVCMALVLWAVKWWRGRKAEPLAPLALYAKKPWWNTHYAHITYWVLGTRLGIALVGALAVVLAGGAWPEMEPLWVKWDAHHYLHIAEFGYTADQSLGDGWLYIVFFPLYPALVAGLGRLVNSFFWAGTAISCAALYVACLGLHKLVEKEYPHAGMRAVRYLLLFPASLFLGIPYTESLFLALSVWALWAMREKRWLMAGVLGLFAALARNAGVLLALPYAICLAKEMGIPGPKTGVCTKLRTWLIKGWPVLLIPAGTCIYLLINYWVYGDAFMFMQIQKNHWYQQAQAFFLSIGTTVEQVFASEPANVQYMWLPQLTTMLLFLAALPAMARQLKPQWGAYLLAFAVLNLSPSWLLSFTRYIMCAAPIYMWLARLGRRKWVDIAISAAFAAAMIYLTVGYALGYSVV